MPWQAFFWHDASLRHVSVRTALAWGTNKSFVEECMLQEFKATAARLH
jgi:hypothetical protein